MTSSKGRNFPFSPRTSASWLDCHVTYEQAVEMFFNQTATQQYMGHDPVASSKVFRGVTYSTMHEAQRAQTEILNAEYRQKEQEALAQESRGIPTAKIINDRIRNRIIQTENGIASSLSYRTPLGEARANAYSLFLGQNEPTSVSYPQQNNQSPTSSNSAAQQAYDLTEENWNEDLKQQAKQYKWDTSEQENVSIAILTTEEANEYLDLLVKDTHGELSTGKDYTGVSIGLKGAYDVAKELGGWGATAKAIEINGTMNIVIENYKPRYLDLGVRWQEATPQMLRIGYALNTVAGNLNFLIANIYVECVFSGAVNAVDYMLHDEKTLGEVVGQFTADVSKGVVAGIVAQGVLLVARAGAGFLFGFSLPAAVGLGLFVYSAFKIGGFISDLDNQYQFTKPMKETVEALID